MSDLLDSATPGMVLPEPAPRPRSGARRRWIVVTAIVLVPLLAFGTIGTWWWWQLDPPGGPGEEIEVDVDEGMGVSDIAALLADEGVIDSGFAFKAYARLKDAGPFQAGTYELRRDLGVRDAIEVLNAGPVIVYDELLVPPGLRLGEIALRVEQQLPGRSAEVFLQHAQSGGVRSKYQPEGVTSLEGMLWPDTYKIAKGEDELAVLQTMVEQFDAQIEGLGLPQAQVEGLTPYQLAIVASLVQSEAKVDADRPKIASVVYNRLRAGMPLQIDATVLYATGKREGITEADQQSDSPYNTYRVTGLPPTPISGVAEVSLAAAAAPETTPYLYYVVGAEDGTHVFAETYEEHLANIEESRRKGLL